jgi:exodeoxyribonuclease VII small subunit
VKKFEEKLSRLEEISEKMKDDSQPIEDAAALFEEGIKLAKSLENELSKIERKIEILVNKPDESREEPELELFPELSET